MKIYLIRHGESINNMLGDITIGGIAKDIPLSKLGELQAQKLGQYLRKNNIEFDSIHSSTAERAKKTAIIASNSIKYPLEQIIYSNRLLEMDRGEWTGIKRTEIYTPENLAKINLDPWNFRPPKGESQRDTETRVLNYIYEEILSKNYSTVALFGHGYAFKTALRGILEFNPERTYKMQYNNTGIIEINHDHKGWHLITFNDTRHLI